jgi:hypothetical protein
VRFFHRRDAEDRRQVSEKGFSRAVPGFRSNLHAV